MSYEKKRKAAPNIIPESNTIQILHEFYIQLPIIKNHCEDLKLALERYCEILGIPIYDHSTRIKSDSGVKIKVEKGKYQSLLDLSDSGGIRFIFHSSFHVKKAFETLFIYLNSDSRPFEWIMEVEMKDNAVKGDGIYNGKHIIVNCSNKFKIEVQLRTKLDNIIYPALHEHYKNGLDGIEEQVRYFIKQKKFVENCTACLESTSLSNKNQMETLLFSSNTNSQTSTIICERTDLKSRLQTLVEKNKEINPIQCHEKMGESNRSEISFDDVKNGDTITTLFRSNCEDYFQCWGIIEIKPNERWVVAQQKYYCIGNKYFQPSRDIEGFYKGPTMLLDIEPRFDI